MHQQMVITCTFVAMIALGCALIDMPLDPTAIVAPEESTHKAASQITPTMEPVESATQVAPSSSSSTSMPVHLPATEPTSLAGEISPTSMESPPVPSATNPPAPLPLVTASSTAFSSSQVSSGAKKPGISTFRANVEEADPGDDILLEWTTTQAMTVTLWYLMPTGQFGRFWNVEPSGSYDYHIDDHERNRINFALSVIDKDGNNEMATIGVTLRCPDQWFFADPPDICPAKAAIFSAGAEQTFEHGFMIWSAGEDRIYILFNDGNSPQWSAFADEWDPGEPESDPNLVIPPGHYQPVRGFGSIWRNEPGVQERLGFAVGQEVASNTVVQRTSYAKYNETFIQAANGGIWHLEPERSGWELMIP